MPLYSIGSFLLAAAGVDAAAAGAAAGRLAALAIALAIHVPTRRARTSGVICGASAHLQIDLLCPPPPIHSAAEPSAGFPTHLNHARVRRGAPSVFTPQFSVGNSARALSRRGPSECCSLSAESVKPNARRQESTHRRIGLAQWRSRGARGKSLPQPAGTDSVSNGPPSVAN